MKLLHPLAASAALAIALLFTPAAHAGDVIVDVTGAQSINLQGEAGNTVWFVDIGANSVLTSLSWAVTLDAFSPSSLSEMQVSFGSADGAMQLTLAPGAADAFSGTGSYSGTLDLTGYGVGAGADGLLRVEFSEAFKDLAPNTADGAWTGGTLTFSATTVPEPAGLTLAAAGLGVLGLRLRHVRRG